VAPAVLLGYRCEQGVESKMLASLVADIEPVRFLNVDAGLSFNLFDNNGLGGAEFGLGGVLYKPAGLILRLAAQHQQWSDWRAGENRLLVLVEAGPISGLDAGVGLVHRIPLFGDDYWSPYVWRSDAPEWNWQYRLRWRFINKENWWLRAGLSTYDRFNAHTPQQLPLEADGAYKVADKLEFVARAGTAIVGYSCGLISFHEVELHAGVKYAF
jgi:hypothetical protein